MESEVIYLRKYYAIDWPKIQIILTIRNSNLLLKLLESFNHVFLKYTELMLTQKKTKVIECA